MQGQPSPPARHRRVRGEHGERHSLVAPLVVELPFLVPHHLHIGGGVDQLRVADLDPGAGCSTLRSVEPFEQRWFRLGRARRRNDHESVIEHVRELLPTGLVGGRTRQPRLDEDVLADHFIDRVRHVAIIAARPSTATARARFVVACSTGSPTAVQDDVMTDDRDLLRHASDLALTYTMQVDARAVAPTPEALSALAAFDEALTAEGLDAKSTIDLLASVGGPATMASTGPNYFGFVNGATLPVALGASMLVNAWDQNTALPVMSPVAASVYDVARRWLVELLGFPSATDVAFVTGATVANATCLAAARDALLTEADWDVQRDGLFGAPPINVVIGQQAHSTLRKSLGLVGLGRERVTIVPADDQGRIRADELPDPATVNGPVLLCAQAGEVNTGAFDPFDDLADWLDQFDHGWMHVDGAFGLWALADPTRAELVAGLTRAHSWAADGHKWLNVTYDCGIAFVRPEDALTRTFRATAGYLPPDSGFEAMHHTPQSSQRPRQVEVWAALRTLGSDGVARLVQQASTCAALIGERLDAAGFEMLNDVVLNQVLVRWVDGPTTERLIAAVQEDGRIWCGPTQWQGSTAMRISVSSWKTTTADAESAADAIIECTRRL